MDDKTQLSFDDQAAQMADQMDLGGGLSKGGAAGDMPTGRPGDHGAEGGFTTDAGGQVIDAGVEGGVAKSGKTGTAMNSEPGPQNVDRNTGSGITDAPARSDGGGAGDGGNLSQSADAGMRGRKSGQIGVSGGSTGGGNLSEDEDDKLRGNRAGKVGITKSQAEAMGLNQDQFNALGDMGLVKGELKIEHEDDDDEDDDAEKSWNANDLIKAVDTLEAMTEGAEPMDRREELGDKLAKGEIDLDEMAELQSYIAQTLDPMEKASDFDQGEIQELEADTHLEKSYQEQFAEDEVLAEGYDVSPFLERQNQMLAASLDQTRASLTKSLDDQSDRAGQFNTLLAKSLKAQAHVLAGQDEMIKSLVGRLETVENQPNPRRGISGVGQLRKAMPSEAGYAAEGPTRSQILDTLEDMAKSGREAAPSGERIDRAVSLYESTGQISKSLMGDVIDFMRNGQAVH